MLKPYNDNVIAIADKAEERTNSGLYLPNKAQEKPATATVFDPGTSSIKVGQKIVYKSYSASEITIDKQEYIFINPEDILGIVE